MFDVMAARVPIVDAGLAGGMPDIARQSKTRAAGESGTLK
jgi:hypothetical protein